MNRVINSTYEILEEIGKGGMSVVYKARHIRLNTVWAVKEVHRSEKENIDLLAEANILKKLNHPSLPRIVDIFEDEKNIYIVEDFVTGDSLQKVIEKEKVIDEARLKEWFMTLCDVLIYLHHQKPNPIIYRDMKPANVMLQNDGTLKLIDFGIAREYKLENRSDTTVVGTRGYAAPEQYGTSQSDARTDIYSLGVTMYYLATGKSPFDPPYTFVPARELNRKLSAGMEHILAKCLQPEPENRYQSVTELLEDLKHIERYDEAYQKVQQKIRNRRILLALLYVTGCVLLVSGLLVKRTEKNTRYLDLISRSAEQSYEEALDTLHEAQKIAPDQAEAYTAEAKLISVNEGWQKAAEYIASLEEAGTVSMAKHPEVFLVKAEADFEMNDYESAADTYRSLSESHKDLSVQSAISYAVCLGRLGRLNEAQAVIDSLQNKADENQLAYLQGEISYLNRQYRSAAESFAKVTQKEADASLKRRAYISLAETYRESAKLSSADPEYIPDANTKMIDVLRTAISQYDLSGNAVLWEMLGQAYYSRGALEKNNDRDDLLASIDAYRRVISLGVQKDYLYVNMFIAAQAMEDYDAAEDVLSEMKGVYPDSYLPYMYHSILLIMEENQKPNQSRNYKNAYEEYKKASGLAKTSDQKEQMQQLEGLIRQLKDGGWIRED